MQIQYDFEAIAWKYTGKASWYFVSLPKDQSKEIRTILKSEEEGWGRLKVKAKISNTDWETAIWFDTKLDTYLLPLKTEIRKKETINDGSAVKASIWV